MFICTQLVNAPETPFLGVPYAISAIEVMTNVRHSEPRVGMPLIFPYHIKTGSITTTFSKHILPEISRMILASTVNFVRTD
jgi:hypothetical protein